MLQNLPQVLLLSQYRSAYQEPGFLVEGLDGPVSLFEILEYLVNNVQNGGDMALASEGIQKEHRSDRSDDLQLPEGAYYIHVKHIDPSGGTITVNGEDLSFGGEYSSDVRYDRTINRQDFAASVGIVSNSKNYALRVSYPSTHPIDISTLD